MARKTEVTPELDALLASPEAPKVAPDAVPETEEPKQDKPESPNPPAAPEQTAEQLELARLRTELDAVRAANLAPTQDGRPLAESALTPEQREIRRMRDEIALEKAKAFERSEEKYEDGEAVRVIHFVADGFTAQGRTWLTGQTVSFGESAYEQTKDRHGKSWLDYTEAEQWRAYGKTYFREGPWNGARYEDEVAREDARRGTAAPLISL